MEALILNTNKAEVFSIKTRPANSTKHLEQVK
jgi:hypothetical protein